ncbi:hypothetical protein [Nitrosomonas communis]|uniref:Uncharacterized protein n=1 Tax=Nitrosomonas communis TaxID=44574 RepID=A0A1I4TPY2_9PROT|nr:hypothetical protein [Nitrosomonas communis]SFM78627.1 hypothetical protein SAMN05421863_10537 [Nitrosomonas communis]
MSDMPSLRLGQDNEYRGTFSGETNCGGICRFTLVAAVSLLQHRAEYARELTLKPIQVIQDFKKSVTAYIFFSAGFCKYPEQSCFTYFKTIEYNG